MLVGPSVSSPGGLALMTTALQSHHVPAVQLRAAGKVRSDGLLPREAQLLYRWLAGNSWKEKQSWNWNSWRPYAPWVSAGPPKDVPSTPQLVNSRVPARTSKYRKGRQCSLNECWGNSVPRWTRWVCGGVSLSLPSDSCLQWGSVFVSVLLSSLGKLLCLLNWQNTWIPFGCNTALKGGGTLNSSFSIFSQITLLEGSHHHFSQAPTLRDLPSHTPNHSLKFCLSPRLLAFHLIPQSEHEVDRVGACL